MNEDTFGAVKLLMAFPEEAVVPQSALRPGDRVRLWTITEAVVKERVRPGDPIFVQAVSEHRTVSLVHRPSDETTGEK